MCILSISSKGAYRWAVVVGPIALEVARNEIGRACNMYEAQLYRDVTHPRPPRLFPAAWASPRGLLLVIRAPASTSKVTSIDERLAVTEQWLRGRASTVGRTQYAGQRNPAPTIGNHEKAHYRGDPADID